jgi:hypothetical protein
LSYRSFIVFHTISSIYDDNIDNVLVFPVTHSFIHFRMCLVDIFCPVVIGRGAVACTPASSRRVVVDLARLSAFLGAHDPPTHTPAPTPEIATTKIFRQGMLWDAAVAARQLSPMLDCLTQSSAHYHHHHHHAASSSSAAGTTMHVRSFHDDTPTYAVENI